MRTRRIHATRGALAALLVTMAMVMPADAAHFPECGALWTTASECLFSVRSLPITVTADASSQGTARVRAWFTVTLPDGEHTLAECSDVRSSRASCSASFVPGQTIDPFVSNGGLTCHVQGVSSGSYRCRSRP